MPKLPRVSGAEAIRALERLGFTQVRQRGSHVVPKTYRTGECYWLRCSFACGIGNRNAAGNPEAGWHYDTRVHRQTLGSSFYEIVQGLAFRAALPVWYNYPDEKYSVVPVRFRSVRVRPVLDSPIESSGEAGLRHV